MNSKYQQPLSTIHTYTGTYIIHTFSSWLEDARATRLQKLYSISVQMHRAFIGLQRKDTHSVLISDFCKAAFMEKRKDISWWVIVIVFLKIDFVVNINALNAIVLDNRPCILTCTRFARTIVLWTWHALLPKPRARQATTATSIASSFISAIITS